MDTEKQPMTEHGQAHAIVALILGILSVLAPFHVLALGPVFGIIMGIIALYQVSVSDRIGPSSLAHSGKVLAIIGLSVSTIVLIAGVIFLVQMGNMMHSWKTIETFTFTGPRFHNVWSPWF
jgi:uncharacterized membrane protein